MPDANVAWLEPFASKSRYGAFAGLDAEISRGADATSKAPIFGSIVSGRLWMPLDDAEYAILSDQAGAVRAGNRLAFLGRHLIDA